MITQVLTTLACVVSQELDRKGVQVDCVPGIASWGVELRKVLQNDAHALWGGTPSNRQTDC